MSPDHGFVELQSEVGRGTTFRVYLPAAVNESPRSTASNSPLDVPRSHGELVLVVDDDVAVRELVASILKKNGYCVISCVDGVDAITSFNTHVADISLVVTDVDMPRLGGMALARALLQLRPDLRLLAMSGLSRSMMDGSEVSEVRKMAHAFLLKPFKPDDLLWAAHHLLHPAEMTE
jgi:two-component system, cell cycle sensor histidine kinase and response regulator CckA